MASLVLLTGCASVSDEEAQNSNLEVKIITKTVEPEDPQQAVEKTVASQPAKDYAALVPDTHKDPNVLLGLSPDRLIDMLGPPGFRRADSPAEIWQYRFGGCVLNLILYETGKKKPLKVAHYTVRSTTQTTVTERNCLLGLLIDRQKRLGGAIG